MKLRIIETGTAVLLTISAAQPLVAQSPQIRSATSETHGDTLRNELARIFRAISTTSIAREESALFSRARSVAMRYDSLYEDAFLTRQISIFRALTRSQRKQRVLADSLRHAGNDALTRKGVPEAMGLWRQSRFHASLLSDETITAPILVSIGGGFYRAGQLDSASHYARLGRAMALRTGDLRTQGNALGILASIEKERGDLGNALTLYRNASRIRSRTGDSRGIAADQNNIGLIARERGEYRDAARAFNQALAINRREKRHSLVALNLSNLAGLASDAGSYASSDSLYRLALRVYSSTGSEAERAFVHHDLGRLRMRRGDYEAAAASLVEALRIHGQTGDLAASISVRTDLAAVQQATGYPERAIETLGRGEREAIEANAGAAARAGLALGRGDLAVQFNSFVEAEAHYLRAEKLYRDERDSAGIAQSRHGRALARYLRGDNTGALELLQESARLQIASADRRSLAVTQLLSTTVQRANGRNPEARRSLHEAYETFRSVDDRVGQAAALSLLGDLTLEAGSIREAEAIYRRALLRLGNRKAIDVQWRLHGGIGRALWNRGALGDAARELRAAIAMVENTASGLRVETARYGYLTDKWSIYTELALVELARGRTSDAFAVSERLRARQLVEMLAKGPIDQASTISAATVSSHQVSARLAEGEVMLEYLLGDSVCTVFVVTRDSITAVPLRISRAALSNHIEFTRRAMERPSESGKEYWRQPLKRLYRELVDPVERSGHLHGKTRLIIVPHAELHFLSFAALMLSSSKDLFLIERYQIAYAPSATAWVRLRDRRMQPRSGVLAFAPHVKELPGSRQEVNAIREIYGKRATLRIGTQASERALREGLPAAGTLHLATLGVLNRRNPLFSFVKLAADEGDDGELQVHKVYGLGLSGQLVVLSACQTATGSGVNDEVPPGDDWVGLVQAFLQGGASSVVASLWPVEDRSTATMMKRFHQSYASGAPPVAALAHAQRETLRRPETSSPFFWAAFLVSGGSTAH